ncbi:MAG TPA: DNA-binding response regulator, partial [Candidatus Eisenbacteria bacterium]|nr:DNA-binding response regulator [Candidatus Eisenbacteria bacterium]
MPHVPRGVGMPVTIVLADDDADMRMLLRHLLTRAGSQMVIVGEAAEGPEALAVVLRERPDV